MSCRCVLPPCIVCCAVGKHIIQWLQPAAVFPMHSSSNIQTTCKAVSASQALNSYDVNCMHHCWLRLFCTMMGFMTAAAEISVMHIVTRMYRSRRSSMLSMPPSTLNRKAAVHVMKQSTKWQAQCHTSQTSQQDLYCHMIQLHSTML